MSDLDRLEAKWRRKHGNTHNAHRVRLLNPPPWPTRTRWAARLYANRIGCWLALHDHSSAAEWWWRALRMW